MNGPTGLYPLDQAGDFLSTSSRPHLLPQGFELFEIDTVSMASELARYFGDETAD